MSIHKDCIHNGVCKYGENRSNGMYCTGDKCEQYKSEKDVVEVVRCHDCKYYQDNNGGYQHEECRWIKEETPNADDYCSYGERVEHCGENTDAER